MSTPTRATKPTLREIIETEASEARGLALRLTYAAGALSAGGCEVSATAATEARARVLWAQREITKLRLALADALHALDDVAGMAPVICGDERTAWDRGYNEGYAEAVEAAVAVAKAGMPERSGREALGGV